MRYRTVQMLPRKSVALIAHDNCEGALLEWARYNRETLTRHELYATGTTGALLAGELDLTSPLMQRDYERLVDEPEPTFAAPTLETTDLP